MARGRERAGAGVGRKRGNGLERAPSPRILCGRLARSRDTTARDGSWLASRRDRALKTTAHRPYGSKTPIKSFLFFFCQQNMFILHASFCSLPRRFRVAQLFEMAKGHIAFIIILCEGWLYFRQGNWVAQWIRGEARRAGRFKLSLKHCFISAVWRRENALELEREREGGVSISSVVLLCSAPHAEELWRGRRPRGGGSVARAAKARASVAGRSTWRRRIDTHSCSGARCRRASRVSKPERRRARPVGGHVDWLESSWFSV